MHKTLQAERGEFEIMKILKLTPPRARVYAHTTGILSFLLSQVSQTSS